MVRPLSATTIAAQNAETTEECWLTLLTIEHSDLAEPIRVVNNFENITSNGNLFVGMPFEIELPEDGPSAPGEARLRIDNVDKQIVETIRVIQSPPVVTIQIIMASDPDSPDLTLSNLTLRNAAYDVHTVQGVLKFEDLTTRPVSHSITPERLPALF